MLEIQNTQEYGLRNRSVAKRDLKADKQNKTTDLTEENTSSQSKNTVILAAALTAILIAAVLYKIVL